MVQIHLKTFQRGQKVEELEMAAHLANIGDRSTYTNPCRNYAGGKWTERLPVQFE
jgi:hypothetical protein